MKLSHRTQDNVDILELSGRFDAYEVPSMTEWFDDRPNVKHVVVNLSGVTFIDSSGLSSLVRGMKHCRQNDGDLVICNAQQAVSIIFELTRLDKAFAIYDDEQSALQGLVT